VVDDALRGHARPDALDDQAGDLDDALPLARAHPHGVADLDGLRGLHPVAVDAHVPRLARSGGQ
jgi:hypothetical protein